MNRMLLRKSLVEARGLLLACTAALFVICWTRVWLVSQFDMGRFRAILDQFREFERFSPVPFAQLLTYSGRIAITFDEPIVLVCLCVWAVARGSDCVSGELNRGTMEILLAQPVSRLQVLWSQAAVTLGGVAVLACATWLGIYAGLHTNSVQQPQPRESWKVPWLPIKIPNPLAEEKLQRTPLCDEVDAAVFVPAAVNLFALGVFVAGLASFFSACDRYRWRTIGCVVGLTICELLLKVISSTASGFHWLRYCTFFSVYEPEVAVALAIHKPEATWALVLRDASGQLRGLTPLSCDLVLIGLGCLAYLGASLVFRRRDLPAPL